MEANKIPKIQNIHIEQSGPLNMETTSGIGFFGTITNIMDENTLGSAGTTVVKNINLQNVSVNNTSTTVEENIGSIVEGLLGLLGGLLGDILDLLNPILGNLKLENVSVNNTSTTVEENIGSIVEGLLGLLGGLLGDILDLLNPILGNLKLGEVIDALLTLKKGSPDLFATGSFAGRIVGDVHVENCTVDQASVTSELGEVIDALLTLKKGSPDLFATGSFAGRIVGDVHVENCTVDQASVTSAKGISGGFVGFTEGVEEYEGLSKLLGGVVKVLSTLLNILPGVGLGDLITILLENDVNLGELIPTGYHKPMITNCRVTLSKGTIGNNAEDYNGGFVGIQTGTKISNSSVSGLTSVQAKNGAGGFAGLERDAIIKGLLNEAGVELYTLDAKSRQESCTVSGSNLSITAAESYAGGFNGVMANSISTASTVSVLSRVSANKYAGGFAGRATVGYGTTLGNNNETKPSLIGSVSKLLEKLLTSNDEAVRNTGGFAGRATVGYGTTLGNNNETKPSLIGSVSKLLEKLLTSNDEAVRNILLTLAGATVGYGTTLGNNNETKPSLIGSVSKLLEKLLTSNDEAVRNILLTLAGVVPSKIHGCSVQGSSLVVESTGDYAGGMIGQGDGVKITAVGAAEFTSGSAGGNVTGLQSVKANKYAGGIAGSVVTADAIGVLNQTLGVGQFIPFELSQVSVEGTNWTVTATEKYAACNGRRHRCIESNPWGRAVYPL